MRAAGAHSERRGENHLRRRSFSPLLSKTSHPHSPWLPPKAIHSNGAIELRRSQGDGRVPGGRKLRRLRWFLPPGKRAHRRASPAQRGKRATNGRPYRSTSFRKRHVGTARLPSDVGKHPLKPVRQPRPTCRRQVAPSSRRRQTDFIISPSTCRPPKVQPH